jgi:hemoglobin
MPGRVRAVGRDGQQASLTTNAKSDLSVYEAAGGRRAFLDLARAWHQRCLQDEVVSHAFSHPGQHPAHLDRLAAYWAESLGGPADYSATMADHGHVLRLHSGNGEHQEMDDRAQACFALALDDAMLPDDERLRSTLRDWFRWATALMAAYPDTPDDVPEGLELPHWSWSGPATSTPS